MDSAELNDKANKIRLLILDVDGVLTDGGIMLDAGENEFKTFHVRDGHGIVMLRKAGIRVALITGRYSIAVTRRAIELGITDVFQKCFDKKTAYRELSEKYALQDEEIAYVGDDVVDLPVMNMCGLSITVADAEDVVKDSASMITKRNGGRGAVREVCDLLLKAKGLWRGAIGDFAEA